MSTVVGIGIDVTDIPRIARMLERHGDRFIERVFTAGEIEYCRQRHDPAVHFAGRFAAKEAAMKALGTGHSAEVLFRGIEVVRTDGAPSLVFHDGALAQFERLGATRALLTISHADAVAIAQVMLLGD